MSVTANFTITMTGGKMIDGVFDFASQIVAIGGLKMLIGNSENESESSEENGLRVKKSYIHF